MAVGVSGSAVWVPVLPDMSRFGQQLTQGASSAGDSASARIGSAMKKGFAVAGAGLAGVLGTALTKGFGRLKDIENAQAKLAGLGHSAKSVQTIMDSALASVKGTAFGLGDAASVAASTVAAGIAPGEDLTRVLKLMGDTATIAGADLGEMGSIFNKVAANGKLTLEEVNQLSDRGVPILQWVAEQYGVTGEAARKMVTEGKVNFAGFAQAIEENIAGAALKSGETTQGAFANMGAALGRFGATLLRDVYPLIGPFFGSITEWLDELNAKAGPAVERFATALADAGRWIRDNAGLIKTLALALTGVVATLWLAVTAQRAYTAALVLYKSAQQAYAFWTYSQAAATGVFTFALNAMKTALLANPVGLMVVALVALGAALVLAYKKSDEFRAVVDKAWAVIKAAVAQAWDRVIKPALAAFTGFITGTLAPAVVWLWRNVIVPAMQGIGAAAVWAWNNVIKPAFNALVVFTRTVLAPTVMWLWNNIAKPAFAGISFAVRVFWNVAKLIFDIAVAYVKNVLAPIFLWLWRNVVKPAFDGIAAVVSWSWNNVIKPIFSALGSFIRDSVAPAFNTGVNAIGDAWNRIKELARAPVNFVIDTVYNNGLRAGFEALAKAVGSDARLPHMPTIGGASTGGASYTGSGARRGFAKGGFATPGWALVGEEGPELVDFRTPGRVYTAAQTQKMLPGTGDLFDAVGAGVKRGTDIVKGAADMLANPFQWLKDRVAGLVGNIGGGDLGRIVGAIPSKMLDTIKAKVEAFFGGVDGAGIGGGSGPGGWQWQMAVLRQVFPGLGLNSGYRPGAITATGNPSMHGRGRAVDVPPRMDVFNWIRANYGANTKELIFSPAGGRQVHNGKPHVYSGITKAMHYDHVHWGYDNGGWLPPGVSQVRNATRQPEAILNPQQWADIHSLAQRGSGGGVTFNGPLQALDPRAVAGEVLTLIRRDEALRGV